MEIGAALNPRLNLLEQVSTFAQADFDYVDLGFDYPLTTASFDTGRFKDSLSATGMNLHGQTPARLPFGSPYVQIRKQAVAVASRVYSLLETLGVRSIIFHPDGTFWFLDEYVDWNLDSLSTIAPNAKTPILLENLPEKPFQTISGFKKLLENTNFNINLDVGHSHIAGPDVLDAFLASNRVRHVHVSDNDGKNDTHLPLGQGKINWQTVKTTLQNANVPELTIESYSGGIAGVLSSKKYWDAL